MFTFSLGFLFGAFFGLFLAFICILVFIFRFLTDIPMEGKSTLERKLEKIQMEDTEKIQNNTPDPKVYSDVEVNFLLSFSKKKNNLAKESFYRKIFFC